MTLIQLLSASGDENLSLHHSMGRDKLKSEVNVGVLSFVPHRFNVNQRK
jgi:hypothetical protein